MVSSVHSLIRQATRERLAAAWTISEQAKQRHLAMAERYAHEAEKLLAAPPSSKMDSGCSFHQTGAVLRSSANSVTGIPFSRMSGSVKS